MKIQSYGSLPERPNRGPAPAPAPARERTVERIAEVLAQLSPENLARALLFAASQAGSQNNAGTAPASPALTGERSE